MKRQKMTLVLIYDDEKILLGMKKRGFGMGKWNGFGGKVEEGEDIFESAQRELFEESCLKIKSKKSLVKRGVINFRFENKPKEILEVNYFSVKSGEIIGEPEETEEMFPRWFKIKEVPYKKMWVDDKHWVPFLLAGKNFKGDFLFTKNGKEILAMKLSEIK
ncbi:MAG TPA: 8-oxo-dGTP diphosphatase [Candidatus Moranbacteria bacterium]|nr:8-oxo-dGTP diphosphatase [Candidatus Moranbacteria bacterium]